MSTAVAETPSSVIDPSPPEDDARAHARRANAALAELRRPVNAMTRLAVVLSALGALAGLVPFVGLAELAGLLLAPGPVDVASVQLVVWLVVVGLGARGLLSGAALTITHFADVRLQAHLRRRMVAHLGRVPLGWFTDHSSGSVRKAAQNDVADLHQLVAHQSVESTAAAVLPVGALAYLLWLDWRLGLLAALTLPIYAAAYAWMMRGYGATMSELDAGFTRVSAAVVEFVSGITVVKAYGRAGRAHDSYRRAATEFGGFYASWVRPMLRVEALSSMTIAAPVVALVSVVGGLLFVARGWVTPIEAMTEILVAMVIPTTVVVLGFGAEARRTAAEAALRIHGLLETPVLPVADVPRVPDGHHVRFERVCFAYEGADVLHDVSLDLEPGTVTALVGPSGSGKSTLATLLPRFHDVRSGAVRLGGVDVRDIAPEELYLRVGFVLQDVVLLRATVAENIRLGRPAADDEAVRAAARAAQVHHRILDLPRGYESVVGDDALLSGGEQQRISIARALLADAPVLLLDEATAFADPESEAAIQEALSTLVAGRTVLVIAHRLTSITEADKIVVLDAGEVVETGTHRELVAAGGRYARLWDAQGSTVDPR